MSYQPLWDRSRPVNYLIHKTVKDIKAAFEMTNEPFIQLQKATNEKLRGDSIISNMRTSVWSDEWRRFCEHLHDELEMKEHFTEGIEDRNLLAKYERTKIAKELKKANPVQPGEAARDELIENLQKENERLQENIGQLQENNERLQVYLEGLREDNKSLRSDKKDYKRLAARIDEVRTYLRLMPGRAEDPIQYTISGDHDAIEIDGATYQYQYCFPTHATEHDIYNYFETEIEGTASGSDFTLLAVGATGTWKSRTVDAVLKGTVNQILSLGGSIDLKAVEVYLRMSYDLGGGGRKKVDPIISSLSTIKIREVEDFDSAIRGISGKRITRATMANNTSSRSHILYILDVNGPGEKPSKTGRIILGDLSGSESEVDTIGEGTNGLTDARKLARDEASAANRDLMDLNHVFLSLGQGQEPIYRNSKLTQLLKPALRLDNWGEVHILGTVSIEKEKEQATRRTFVVLKSARSPSILSDISWLCDDN